MLRVLRGSARKYRISEQTEKLILKQAKECGYSPSILARSLRTHKSFIIGLVIPCVENHYFATIASIIIAEAKRYGYQVFVADSGESEKFEQEEINNLIARGADAIIAVPCGDNSALLETLSETIPILLIDRYYKDSSLPFIGTDNYVGAVEAPKYLISNGHKSMSGIQGTPSYTTVKVITAGVKVNSGTEKA